MGRGSEQGRVYDGAQEEEVNRETARDCGAGEAAPIEKHGELLVEDARRMMQTAFPFRDPPRARLISTRAPNRTIVAVLPCKVCDGQPRKAWEPACAFCTEGKARYVWQRGSHIERWEETEGAD
jgi:hypothetical protein